MAGFGALPDFDGDGGEHLVEFGGGVTLLDGHEEGLRTEIGGLLFHVAGDAGFFINLLGAEFGEFFLIPFHIVEEESQFFYL